LIPNFLRRGVGDEHDFVRAQLCELLGREPRPLVVLTPTTGTSLGSSSDAPTIILSP
jgi:hypothetical protein